MGKTDNFFLSLGATVASFLWLAVISYPFPSVGASEMPSSFPSEIPTLVPSMAPSISAGPTISSMPSVAIESLARKPPLSKTMPSCVSTSSEDKGKGKGNGKGKGKGKGKRKGKGKGKEDESSSSDYGGKGKRSKEDKDKRNGKKTSKKESKGKRPTNEIDCEEDVGGTSTLRSKEEADGTISIYFDAHHPTKGEEGPESEGKRTSNGSYLDNGSLTSIILLIFCLGGILF